jgi:phosphopantothenoylcysteine decarboxylase/phosphopantothenate--cysteine ligase
MADEPSSLTGRRIMVGITGSIAAYKAVVLVRLLSKAGARVQVVMTRSAREFVGESTLSGLTGRAVLTDMFDRARGGELHVALARESDLIVVAPATADSLARLANGRADDLLAATVLCARCPVLVAPAMHPSMWAHPATARNVSLLARDGVEILGPVEGEVASGETGLGRMLEPEELARRVRARLAGGDLKGFRLIVTAGPTVEDLDPVRFISNRSSGKMGFALAERAARRGAAVTLIAGPVALGTPSGVLRVDVRSAVEMRDALFSALGPNFSAADALLMSAAVGDYRAARVATEKLKRGEGGASLELAQNPDILAEVGGARKGVRPVLVGFAVETGTDGEIVLRARQKLRKKGVDVVIANHAAESMGRDDNRVLVVGPTETETMPAMPKSEVAERIVDWLAKRLQAAGAPRRARTGKMRAAPARAGRSPGRKKR